MVTVSTASTHGLTNKDSVFLNVLPGITTTVKVAYNDYNRRLVINPRTFASGDVDVSTNTITIPRHGYSNGQKVIYTASTASGGLFNNGIYYAYVVDLDSIKLCNEYYQSRKSAPIVVDITSASAGTISPINPNVKVENCLLYTSDAAGRRG